MSVAGRHAIPLPAPAEDQLKDVPEPPRRLKARGKRVWTVAAGQMIRQGLLTLTDLELLEEYCVLADKALELQSNLDKKGATSKSPSGYECQRPQVAMLNKTREHLRQFANELGLTPSSRTRLGVKAGQSAVDRMKAARDRLRKG